MIWNIRDHRHFPHRWRKVRAIVEDVRHDNGAYDGDDFDEANPRAPLYDERGGILLNEAIAWAENMPGKVTLYLYDNRPGRA